MSEWIDPSPEVKFALLCRAVEADGGVPYMMRLGDVPENDSYDFLGEGIRDLIGVQAGEVTHRVWVDRMREVVPDDPGYTGDPADYGRAFKRGEVPVYRVRVRVVLPDGTERWLRDVSAPVRDVEGKLIATVGILREAMGSTLG
ncbi:PAS domain-containing protein [Candidatus Sumerlaeota bacterium]|nr:PAS domain-containing protein [Candidatus Sumerlaeota bacterium]